MSSSAYQPPTDLFEVNQCLEPNEALDKDDPRYVDTAKARGDFSFRKLYRHLNVKGDKPDNLSLEKPLKQCYLAFCGHRGCGKSTELRRLSKHLHQPSVFFVVFMDVLEELDYNNLNYADVLLALAKNLFAQLAAEQIEVDAVLLRNLEDWFIETVEKNEKTQKFAAEIKAGASIDSGVILFFSKVFASLQSSVQNENSYKTEVRRVVENSFSQFSSSFNKALMAIEESLKASGKGRKLLFVVDGTDRLRDEDSQRFFVRDVNQLQQIEANFIYVAPIHLIHESNQMQQSFYTVSLPMIKLHEKGETDKFIDGYQAMREMVFRRSAPQLFESPALIEQLIQFSGGNPRELFKLIKYAFLRTDEDVFDAVSVRKAIEDLATDYRRILDAEDYALLAEVDKNSAVELNSERMRHFLYNLIVLEYNGFWRETHPVIKTLQGYQHAQQAQ